MIRWLKPSNWPPVLQGIAFFGALFALGYLWSRRGDPPPAPETHEIKMQVAQPEEVDPEVLLSMLGAEDTIAVQDQAGREVYCGLPTVFADSLREWKKEGATLTWGYIIERLKGQVEQTGKSPANQE